MNDAELVRLIAGNLYKRVSMMGRDEPTLQDLLTERADRLTAIADRLDGGVIVPREPSADFAAWLQREMPAGTVIGDPGWWVARIYRAMLTASEAK